MKELKNDTTWPARTRVVWSFWTMQRMVHIDGHRVQSYYRVPENSQTMCRHTSLVQGRMDAWDICLGQGSGSVSQK